MTVYIEIVIIDNFFITLLTSILSYRILSVKNSVLRVLITSVIGTVAAVFYPFLKIHNAFLILIKFALCALLSFVLFYKKCNILKGSLAFLFTTFLFGGALFSLGLMIYADVDKALRLPLTNIPTGAIIGAGLLIYAFIRIMYGKLKRIKDAASFKAEVEIDIFDKTVKGSGFLDTGNRLYDFKSGLPVVILSSKAALSVLDHEKLRLIVEKKGESIDKSAHYIDYKTVGGKANKILILQPDEIRLYSGDDEHRIKDVMVGLSFSKFSDSVEYDVILHSAILNKEVQYAKKTNKQITQ